MGSSLSTSSHPGCDPRDSRGTCACANVRTISASQHARAKYHHTLDVSVLPSLFAHRIILRHFNLARSTVEPDVRQHTDRIIDDRTIDRVECILQVRT